MREMHLKHKIVGDIFEDSKPQQYKLIKDEACGGKQHIPLFNSKDKSRKTEFCNVDLLVLKDNRIRIIVEIEESNVKPTQVCGKFLTSALAKWYIHDSAENQPIGMSSSVTFVQVLDASKLPDKTSKNAQWAALEKEIAGIVPVKGSKISSYKLLIFNDASKLNFASQVQEIFKEMEET